MSNTAIQNQAIFENGWSDGFYGNVEASDHAAYLSGYAEGKADRILDVLALSILHAPVMVSHSVVFVPSDGAHPVRRVTYP